MLMYSPRIRASMGYRPPVIVPEPWSPMVEIYKATRLPCRLCKSIFLMAARADAVTSSCSTAKRLPPPWEGMPVRVPQAVRNRIRVRGRSFWSMVFPVSGLELRFVIIGKILLF